MVSIFTLTYSTSRLSTYNSRPPMTSTCCSLQLGQWKSSFSGEKIVSHARQRSRAGVCVKTIRAPAAMVFSLRKLKVEDHGIVHHAGEVADNHINLENSRSLGFLCIFERHGEKGFNDA